jgi:hypothetical protein
LGDALSIIKQSVGLIDSYKRERERERERESNDSKIHRGDDSVQSIEREREREVRFMMTVTIR